MNFCVLFHSFWSYFPQVSLSFQICPWPNWNASTQKWNCTKTAFSIFWCFKQDVPFRSNCGKNHCFAVESRRRCKGARADASFKSPSSLKTWECALTGPGKPAWRLKRTCFLVNHYFPTTLLETLNWKLKCLHGLMRATRKQLRMSK